MHNVPLNRETLRARLSYIEDSIKSLGRFTGMSFDEFHSNPDNFRIAFYDLRRALEAAMDIGSHILSRIPERGPRRTRKSQDFSGGIRSCRWLSPTTSSARWRGIGTEWSTFIQLLIDWGAHGM